MSKTLVHGITALAVTACAWSVDDAVADALGGGSRALCPAPIVLAQVQMKKQLQFKVPSGENYVKRRGRRTFDKIAAGTVLEGTDCVKIKCPGGFGDDVTCWECHESLTSGN